tara:strand:+ start:360 stop:1061 length:702 start_codon:yes stop_codon:yes gene_type:complete
MYNTLRQKISDKELVKNYISKKIGSRYAVPTLMIFKNKKEVKQESIPNKCVIKSTHGNSQMLIRRNGENLDIDLIKSWLSEDYYKITREGNYRYLQPKIIVEPIVFSEEGIFPHNAPVDYRVFCYNGIAKLLAVDMNRYIKLSRIYFDLNLNRLYCGSTYPLYDGNFELPKNIRKIIELAENISSDFKGLIRPDFYTNGSQIYVGEITNLPGGAHNVFYTPNSEKEISELIFN